MILPFTTLVKSTITQILASISGCTVLFSFGLMLGWPSPTYLNLLKPNATVPITIEQSAMIAGALMLGSFAGTPFSATRLLESKHALIVSMCFILTGWIILWQLKSLYGLLGSRFCIGLGNGFGSGQLKMYLQEICKPNLGKFFLKYSVAFVNVGVLVAYSVGGLSSYNYIAFVGIGCATLFIVILVHIPQSPMHLLMQDRKENAVRSLEVLRRYSDVEKIDQLQLEAAHKSSEQSMNIWEVLKSKETRGKYFILILLVFVQQYCGIAPTTVYCQLILTYAGCPNPEYWPISFAITYMFSTILGVKFSDSAHKKAFLVFSCVLTCLAHVAQIAALLYDFNIVYWKYTTLLIVNIYAVVYSLGLGSVPGFYLNERFPKPAKYVAATTFGMCAFIFGLIATKIFQVLYKAFGLYAPFCFFLASTTLGSVIIVLLPLFDCDAKISAIAENTKL